MSGCIRGRAPGGLLFWPAASLYAHCGEAAPLREVLRVAEHGERWGVPAQWE